MRCMLAVLFVVLGLAGIGWAETGYVAVNVTDVSQTVTLNRVADGIAVCNSSTTDAMNVRIFSDSETAAAATTSYQPIPAGTSAGPYCVTWDHTPRNPGIGFRYVTLIAAAGKTPTGWISYE